MAWHGVASKQQSVAFGVLHPARRIAFAVHVPGVEVEMSIQARLTLAPGLF
jgi:hypothetical protein